MRPSETWLEARYRAHLDKALGLSPEARRFYAPHFLAESSEWRGAPKRVMFVGQETRDWGWYENKNRQITLDEASHRLDAVGLLIDGYRRFDFARDIAGLTNSPLWKFFHILNSRPAQTLLWNNLIKAAAPTEMTGGRSYSILNCPDFVRAEVLNWQRGLLHDEIEMFQPTHVLFLTGPLYDDLLVDVLDDAKFEEIPGCNFGERAAAMVLSSTVNVPMIRLYHPGYSQRARIFDRQLAVAQMFIDQR